MGIVQSLIYPDVYDELKKGDEVLEGKECVLLSEHDINFILTSIENANSRLDKIEKKLKEN